MTNLRPGIAWSMGAAGPVLAAIASDEPRAAGWTDFALCAEVDPDRWFPDDGASPWEPMMICRRCPVRVRCLRAAKESGCEEGVWGGVLFEGGRITLAEVRCGNGLHLMDEANTWTDDRGHHNCRACGRDRRQGSAALERVREERRASVVQRLQAGEKLCTGPCGETKQLNQFSRKAAAPDGLQAKCKDCRGDIQRAARAAERQEVAA